MGDKKRSGRQPSGLAPFQKWKNTLFFWRKWQGSPPSNFMQHINIWVTIVLTATATLIAVTSYFQTQQIQGMQEVLNTFNAKVKFTPEKVLINKDSIYIDGRIRNFGTRSATDITTHFYLLSDSICFRRVTETIMGLSSMDELGVQLLMSERSYINNDGVSETYIEDFMLNNLSFVFKTTFTDELTNKPDSILVYGINISNDTNSIRLRSAPTEEKDSLDILCSLVELLAPPGKIVNANKALMELRKGAWSLRPEATN